MSTEALTPEEEARLRTIFAPDPTIIDSPGTRTIRRLLATLDAERAARQEAADTSAWLIERGQPERQVPTVWFGAGGWTDDANKAHRYASREQAEARIASDFTPPPSRGGPSARAVEHRWLDTSYHARRVARRRQAPADTSGLRCAAIWNGCRCGRAPHTDDRHVWMNTLDKDRAVDPAQYPQEAADTSGHRLDVVEAMEREGVVTWGDDGHRARFLALREAADTSGLREQVHEVAVALAAWAQSDTSGRAETYSRALTRALAAGATERPLDVETVVRETMNVLGVHPWFPRTADVMEQVLARLSPTATPEAGT
jgi:hypothetical protein